MRKWLAIPLVLLIAFVMLISSCGGTTTTTTTAPPTTPKTTTPATTPGQTTTTSAPEPTPQTEAPWGTITVAIQDFGAEATDPTFYESTWGWAMYDSIITTNKEGQYIGEVAKTWDISPDGKTWTFHLRDDIKFHNGDPLTSADVLFTMSRFTSDKSTNPWSSGLRINLDHMEAPDANTFVFVTKNPELPLSTSFAATRIIPKNYFEAVGEEQFRLKPMGSGPWMFVEHVPETKWHVTANVNYWDPNNIPAFKDVVEIQVPEMATQVAMFKNGEVDIPIGITTDMRVELESQGYRMQTLGLLSPVCLNIQGTWFTGDKNGRTFATQSKAVRQALSYAINRQELCDTYYRGTAVPGGQFALMPGGKGAAADIIAPDAYDVAKAKSLLAEANYPAAFGDPVVHLYTTAGPGLDFMQAIQGYWDEAGIQTKIEVVEATVWLAYFFNPAGMTADSPNIGWIWSWTGGAFDSTYMQKNLLTSYGVHNMVHDPAVDALWDKYIKETDAKLSDQYFTDFLRAGYLTKNSIGLVMVEPKMAVSDRLGAFTTNTHLWYSDAYSGIKHPAGAKPNAKGE